MIGEAKGGVAAEVCEMDEMWFDCNIVGVSGRGMCSMCYECSLYDVSGFRYICTRLFNVKLN